MLIGSLVSEKNNALLLPSVPGSMIFGSRGETGDVGQEKAFCRNLKLSET